MQNACAAAGRFWNPQRCPPYIDAFPLLTPEGWPPIARIHLPLGVIGGRDDRPHLMSVRSKPRRHFSRVFAYTCGLGSKVDAIDEDLHDFELGRQTGLLARSIRQDPDTAAFLVVSIPGEANRFSRPERPAWFPISSPISPTKGNVSPTR